MKLEAIPIGENPPDDVNVIIEIPSNGDPIKYEMDKASGALFVDRFLQTSMRYPCNYGFIPHTRSDDGDPIDALVISTHPVIPGSVIRSRPIGVLMMRDEAGVDEKLIMLPIDKLTPFYENITSYNDLPQIMTEQIKHFFSHYKDMEKNKWVEILQWGDLEKAREFIMQAVERSKKQ